MNKDKRIKELEGHVFFWFLFAIACLIGILLLAIFPQIDGRNRNLQEEIDECQIELRKSNWNNEDLSFSYVCDDIKGGWMFNDAGDYHNAISVLENLNCEVIE